MDFTSEHIAKHWIQKTEFRGNLSNEEPLPFFTSIMQNWAWKPSQKNLLENHISRIRISELITFAHFEPSFCQILALPFHLFSQASGHCCSHITQYQNSQQCSAVSGAMGVTSVKGEETLRNTSWWHCLAQLWSHFSITVQLHWPAQEENGMRLDSSCCKDSCTASRQRLHQRVISMCARWGHPQGVSESLSLGACSLTAWKPPREVMLMS